MRRSLRIAALVTGLLAAWLVARPRLRRVPKPAPEAIAQARNVTILRDAWGIPHVFGKTDADTAFGFAYAHAEDNWPLLELVLAAARGKLSLVKLSSSALANDYLVGLLGIASEVDAQYEKALSPEFRRVLEAYARGANYYAALHPREADPRLLPVTGKDIAAGFLHKLPLFMGLGDAIRRARASGAPRATPAAQASRDPGAGGTWLLGSNAHAVAPWRSADGVARLNVNSHQPWEGPVAWYEAQLVSEEGWNMTGGAFPGAPFILHGHNDHLGWAHTVNRPPLVETVRLEMDPSGALRYRVAGGWEALRPIDVTIEIDLGLFTIPWTKKAYQSRYGPALETPSGWVAFRWAGMGRLIGAPEQWFLMNKARDLASFKQAMRRQAIPMFNTVYADRENIYYVYNALLPLRAKDGTWTGYLPYDRLPQVENPPSGFVQSCNASPFQTTTGPGNPSLADYDPALGIETRMTNRAVRSLELFGGARKISAADFQRFKFDRAYSRASPLYREAIAPLLEQYRPRNDDEKRGLALLAAWDGVADDTSRAAALGVLTLRPIAVARELERDAVAPPSRETFADAVAFLLRHFGRLDVPLTTVQRLRRGSLDLPLGGGPDVLNAAYSRIEGGHLVGELGDSYVLLVEFRKEGARSWAIHQYGDSEIPGSRHYADQAPLFVARTLRETWRTREAIEAHLERAYPPGG